MRLHYAVLLTIFLADSYAVSTPTDLEKTNVVVFKRLARSIQTRSLSNVGNRLLRDERFASIANDDETADNEERGFVLKLKYRGWLASGKKPSEVFKKLEAQGVNLTEDSNLLAWMKYVLKYRAKKGKDFHTSGFNVFYTMVEKVPEDKLTALLTTMRKDPKLKGLSTELQEMQYARWLDNEVAPDHVMKMLGLTFESLPQAEARKDPAFDIVREYILRYAASQASKITRPYR